MIILLKTKVKNVKNGKHLPLVKPHLEVLLYQVYVLDLDLEDTQLPSQILLLIFKELQPRLSMRVRIVANDRDLSDNVIEVFREDGLEVVVGLKVADQPCPDGSAFIEACNRL